MESIRNFLKAKGTGYSLAAIAAVCIFLFLTILSVIPMPKSSPSSSSQSSTLAATTKISSLPSFGLGLAAGQGDTLMPNSGIPWSYAYQYLAGDVNGSNWSSWNANGTFANNYAAEKASHNYIPVFTYYLMCQSNGCSSDEHKAYITGLNTVSSMKNYYANFKLLMQRLGSGTVNGIQGFGKTAIVQIEPDFSGNVMQAVNGVANCYSDCTTTGNDPSFLKAAVASTGDPDLAGLPNTYQGYNWALLHLRDLYAPNVSLGFHISNWATGADIGQDHSASTNPTSLGQQVGNFINKAGFTGLPSGIHSYDLIFSDVLDRDAGYYKAVYGNPNAWWDRLNTRFPNFKRFETYIQQSHIITNKPVMLWQLPEGNQYYDTENNSNNHYQDNRVEYFLGQNLDFTTNHIAELENVGIIALLFGPGAGGQSNIADQGPDGVTNPASFCTTDGLSTGQICNNHTSSLADDDGGYLRQMATKFYQNSLPNPSPTSPTQQPSPTQRPVPTNTPFPTPTPNPVATNVSLNLGLHDLGKAGDTVNPTSPGNMNPLHATRNITVMVFDGQNTQATSGTGIITFKSSSGFFSGTVSLGSLAAGQYTIKVHTDGYLTKRIPGILNLTAKQTTTLPFISLTTGDINNDNLLDIRDYNLILNCFGSAQQSQTCHTPPTSQATGADINDDGVVDGADYNAFLRELSIQSGD